MIWHFPQPDFFFSFAYATGCCRIVSFFSILFFSHSLNSHTLGVRQQKSINSVCGSGLLFFFFRRRFMQFCSLPLLMNGEYNLIFLFPYRNNTVSWHRIQWFDFSFLDQNQLDGKKCIISQYFFSLFEFRQSHSISTVYFRLFRSYFYIWIWKWDCYASRKKGAQYECHTHRDTEHVYAHVSMCRLCMRLCVCVYGGYVYFDIVYGLNGFVARTKNFRVV